MLSKSMQKALNGQIQKEFASSYLYLAMAAYCETKNLPGMATWLKVQAQEEWGHGMKIYEFVNDRGGTVTLQAIEQPPAEFGSPVDIFKGVLEHEQKITAAINDLYAQAVKENDYATQIMLQWFITEQVEEEKNASDILELLKMAGEHVIVLDHRLGKRGAA
ncbi:MAG: ferritin [Chthonomonadales bacterium]|nr:ferritin [Chthonomonadales bacterium]